MKPILSTLLIAFLLFVACDQEKEKLYSGIVIKESVTLEKDTFFLNGNTDWSKPAITIEGDDLIVDFNGGLIIGSKDYTNPNFFKGIGVNIRKGKNITIKNFTIQGYKVGLRAEGIDGLEIENADLSYNYRQDLKSNDEKENEKDRMIDFQNEEGDWLQYGMAIYLKNCKNAEVKNIKTTEGQNGLIMNNCNDGLFYNNIIKFNSGIGIGLFHSSNNRIMHNQLDWNVRGFRYKTYNKDYGSAGILLQKQSNKNIIAFNSATHSNQGISIDRSLSSIDSTDNRSSENTVYKNNFSYATNKEIQTKVSESNWFLENKTSSLEEGNKKKEDTSIRKEDHQYQIPKPLLDGVNTFAPNALGPYTGLKHIIMDDFGPYNFKYPKLVLRSIENNIYTFAIFGPFGNWKATGGTGFKMMSTKTGTIPATLVLEAEENSKPLTVDLEYLGPEFFDAFGQYYKKGFPYKLKWENKHN